MLLAARRGHWRRSGDIGGQRLAPSATSAAEVNGTGGAAGTLATQRGHWQPKTRAWKPRAAHAVGGRLRGCRWPCIFCLDGVLCGIYIYIYIGHGLHTVSDQRVCMCEYGYIHMYVRVDVCTASCMYGLNQYPAYLNIQVCTCKHRSINSHIDKKMYMWFMFACGRLYIYIYIRRCTCA